MQNVFMTACLVLLCPAVGFFAPRLRSVCLISIDQRKFGCVATSSTMQFRVIVAVVCCLLYGSLLCAAAAPRHAVLTFHGFRGLFGHESVCINYTLSSVPPVCQTYFPPNQCVSTAGIVMDPTAPHFDPVRLACTMFAEFRVKNETSGAWSNGPGITIQQDPSMCTSPAEAVLLKEGYVKGTDYLAFCMDERSAWSDQAYAQSVEDAIFHLAAASQTGKVAIIAQCGGAIFSRWILSVMLSPAAKKLVSGALFTVAPFGGPALTFMQFFQLIQVFEKAGLAGWEHLVDGYPGLVGFMMPNSRVHPDNGIVVFGDGSSIGAANYCEYLSEQGYDNLYEECVALRKLESVDASLDPGVRSVCVHCALTTNGQVVPSTVSAPIYCDNRNDGGVCVPSNAVGDGFVSLVSASVCASWEEATQMIWLNYGHGNEFSNPKMELVIQGLVFNQ
jgi:hypothetical protein